MLILAACRLSTCSARPCDAECLLQRWSTWCCCPALDGRGGARTDRRRECKRLHGRSDDVHRPACGGRADERRPVLRIAVSGAAACRRPSSTSSLRSRGGHLRGRRPVGNVAGRHLNETVYGRKPGTVGRAIWGTDAEIQRPRSMTTSSFCHRVRRGRSPPCKRVRRVPEQPDATAAALVDGRFWTGDLGVRDADGSSRSSTERRN